MAVQVCAEHMAKGFTDRIWHIRHHRDDDDEAVVQCGMPNTLQHSIVYWIPFTLSGNGYVKSKCHWEFLNTHKQRINTSEHMYILYILYMYIQQTQSFYQTMPYCFPRYRSVSILKWPPRSHLFMHYNTNAINLSKLHLNGRCARAIGEHQRCIGPHSPYTHKARADFCLYIKWRRNGNVTIY